MRELRIVLRREFLERVRTKSFLLSTLLTPLFFLLILAGPVFSERLTGGDDVVLAVVDESGTDLGSEVARALSAGAGSNDDRYFVSAVEGGARATRDSLATAVLQEELDGYVVLPPDVLTGGPLHFRARSVTDTGLQRRIGEVVTSAVRSRRLAGAGIDPAVLARVMEPVRVEAARLTGDGETGESAEAGMFFSIIVGFALYMLILLYGVQVLQSVQEEKSNRIAEILVSSMKASHLMLGKVLGVGLAALLQIGIWLLVAASLGGPLASRFGGSGAGAVSDLMSRIDPGVITVVLAFLLLGFFLYASLFAAAGAAAESSEDAQRFTFPLIMPLLVPMMLTGAIISAPQDTVAVTLSWFPLTMPLAMPMRMGAGGTTPLDVAGSLVVLALSVLLLGVVAGKIYRIGILSTGKRPTMRELARWVRTA